MITITVTKGIAFNTFDINVCRDGVRFDGFTRIWYTDVNTALKILSTMYDIRVTQYTFAQLRAISNS